MWNFLKGVLSSHNDFASGGLFLMILGSIGVWLRAVPEMIWDWCVQQTTMTITVVDHDSAFVWVKEWFLEQNFVKRSRRVDLDTRLRSERITMLPAPGKHWFMYRGRPFEVWFSRTESKGDHYGPNRRVESLTFRTIGRNRAVLKGFVDDVMKAHLKSERRNPALWIFNDGWSPVEGYSARLLESVILQPGEKEYLLQDMARFRASKRRYQTLGVPYHRGYLFYGPPGTGKTSLVSALAAHFGLTIYCLNLGDFNDRSLAGAVGQVPSSSVLLFEDIDCMNGSQARAPRAKLGAAGESDEKGKTQSGVTLSGLLNVLDGFLAPSGVMFAMTTNCIEQLDSALLRPGRIDLKLYLGKACDYQKVELYRRFFPEASEAEAREFLEAARDAETMADFQGLLLALEQGEDLPVATPQQER
jgi:mitochondrial chaperone BCS1